MVSAANPTPAFGQADLSNCEREQIHLAGSIQPHGALLVLTEPDLLIVQASDNASEFLDVSGKIVGRSIEDLGGDLSWRIRPYLREPLHTIPVATRCEVGSPPREFDCQLHRPSDGGLVIEFERTGPPVDMTKHVESALKRIVAASSLRNLCDETAKLFRELTGYDRVMVYRFDNDGHGEVFSEEKVASLEPYLGNRYPASDIPQIARRLYERNRVRVLVDVEYEAVPVLPRLSQISGQDFDMSLCFLRSMSPIHIQYLKNMGVGATLVVSLVVGGELWGLVACHHYEPRMLHYEMRTVCELLAETIATRLSALESFAQAQAEVSVRRLEQRMVDSISREGDWRSALFDSSDSLLRAVNATGAVLLFEGGVLTTGDVPSTPQLREIGNWLDSKPREGVVATASLAIDNPDFDVLTPIASGLLAVPVSTNPGDFLIWFRPEQVRTVTWGGNPFKPVQVGDDPSDLSPRRSFSQWHQLVEGTSEHWTPADQTAARLIGETLTDVVLQFRSVRMLIAQDQLEKFSGQVRRSEQPVMIADASGRVLLTNEPLQKLFGAQKAPVLMMADLPALFADPAFVRQRLTDLLENGRPWRGEVTLKSGLGDQRPLLVRADPVFSAPNEVLGLVLLFTDLTERKAAEIARRRFQEGILEDQRLGHIRLDSKSDLLYRNLLNSVLGNAQLAALEITDSLDLPRVPSLLESVHTSVSRTSELLEHLIWHATRAAEDKD